MGEEGREIERSAGIRKDEDDTEKMREWGGGRCSLACLRN